MNTIEMWIDQVVAKFDGYWTKWMREQKPIRRRVAVQMEFPWMRQR